MKTTQARNIIRSCLKQLTPRFVVRGVKATRTALQRTSVPRVRASFEHAGSSPEFLGINDLLSLQRRYRPLPDYGYDSRTLDKRGLARAQDILRLPGGSTAVSYLELGCWDGMVSYHLHRLGKLTTAIDIRTEGFDDRARQCGVTLLDMDAAHLEFPDESFDFVFSYDTMEHCSDPEGVLRNALRVLKRDGRIFFSFGPLFMSPFGLHAYRTITVPYCQFLFQTSTLEEFVTAGKPGSVVNEFVNGWPNERYKNLWRKYSDSLKTVRYSETLNLAHLDLIEAYPSCFRSKTDRFENLIVESIAAVFQKTR